jgi:hypothetical protein
MDLKDLKQHIRSLIALEETPSPVISCYLNLESGEAGFRHYLNAKTRGLRKVLSAEERQDFEAAHAVIETYVKTELISGAKGAAIFSRAGEMPFFLPLQFRVPLPNWIVTNNTPNIYHLVELKDTYHRYVVLLSTEDSARIFEVNLGSVTEQMWLKRPELRERVGREWTKRHYQNHRRQRGTQFIREKIKLLEQLMAQGGSSHLILAGSPQITARVRRLLPKHLTARLIDTVTASGKDNISDIVAATISSFIEHEAQESRETTELLFEEIKTNGMAVCGADDSLKALKARQVDVLVLAQEFAPEGGWRCVSCHAAGTRIEKTDTCPECGSAAVEKIDIREEIVKTAERYECRIETVKHSDVLMELGGVGCLLRFLTPEQHQTGFFGSSAPALALHRLLKKIAGAGSIEP